MLEGLALVAGADRFIVYLRPGAVVPASIRDHEAFTVRRLRGGGLVRYGLSLPRAVRADGADLLHVAVHAPLASPVPVALMLPDLSFVHHPELFGRSTRARLAALVPLHVRQARVVMTVSEFSRRDIVATYRVAEEKVVVVPNAVSVRAAPVHDPVQRASWLAAHGITAPFFLYLGNLQPRKNLPRLIQAFAAVRREVPALRAHSLVLAGEHWSWGGARERLDGLAPPGSVIFLGRVTDHERDLLFRETVAFVYPSLYEGFGLPPLEALAAGAPVIASRVSAMPEVLGDAALLVDPLDVRAIASALVRVATDDDYRSVLRRFGPARASNFSARVMGSRAISAFQLALRGH